MKAALRGLLRRLGFEVTRIPAEFSSPETRRTVILRDQRTQLLVDVGADRGGYSRNARRCGFAGEIVSVEPRSDAFRDLIREASGDPRWQCFRTALGEVDGSGTLSLSRRGTSSSLLPMLPEHERVAPGSGSAGTEETEILRLDSLLSRIGLMGLPSFLKLDVQGYEGHVLGGATAAMEFVRAVEVELSTRNLYEGGILFRSVVDTLDDLGFQPISFDEVLLEPGTGFVLQFDGIFVR
jgi:FkbM family methyltransferase